ncbi:hypothetical protein PO909_009691 [Leuciscus waleckii]
MVRIFSSNPSFSFHPLMTDLLLIMEFQSLPDPKPKQPILPPKSGCSRELRCVGNGRSINLMILLKIRKRKQIPHTSETSPHCEESGSASEGGGLLPAFLSATFRATFWPSKVLTIWKACFCPQQGSYRGDSVNVEAARVALTQSKEISDQISSRSSLSACVDVLHIHIQAQTGSTLVMIKTTDMSFTQCD